MATLRFFGGINERDDFNVSSQEATEGYNFQLDFHRGTLKPRLPQQLVTTVPNAGEVTGIMELIKRDDSQTILIAAGTDVYSYTGAVHQDVGNITADGRLRSTYWSLDDILVITDLQKNNVVKKWDGSTFGNLTHGIGGVTNLYAKYGVVHNGRVWLANITTDSTELPHMLLASEFENAESYDSTTRSQDGAFTGNEAFYLLSPDLRPINGIHVFYDTIVGSTEDGKLFRLTGSDSTDYDFIEFYAGSAAHGEEAMVNVGNDIAFFRQGHVIESFTSTDRFGDVNTDDISWWIANTLRNTCDVRAVYDRENQKVLFFCDTLNQVYVLDKQAWLSPRIGEHGRALSPWTFYTTNMSNNFDTKAVTSIREPFSAVNKRTIWWGDSAGQVFNFNGDATPSEGDAGSSNIDVYRKTKYVESDAELNLMHELLIGGVNYRRQAAVDLELTGDWSTEYNRETVVVPLKAPAVLAEGAFWGGESYWGITTQVTEWDEGATLWDNGDTVWDER